MGIVKDIFISDSTLGLLKGEPSPFSKVSYFHKDKTFDELDTKGKFVAFITVSLTRFLVNLLTAFLPVSFFISALFVIIYNDLILHSWWESLFRGTLGFTLLITFMYLAFRTIVNIVSFIYYGSR